MSGALKGVVLARKVLTTTNHTSKLYLGWRMRQTTLSVVLEVEPASVGRLSSILEDLKRDEETLGGGVTQRYDRLKRGVPTLHFISMSVFESADYDPLFVIEANFDGRPGPFWGQMEETLSEYLRPMLRCC